MRREYSIRIHFNGRLIRRVLIDPHYEIRHKGSIDDQLILRLVELLDWQEFPAQAKTSAGFEIFRIAPVILDGKHYRLIVTLPPEMGHEVDYVGVVNAFRVHQKKTKGGPWT